jgi:hypothetical protein
MVSMWPMWCRLGNWPRLRESVDVLSDPQLVSDLREAVADALAGRVFTAEQVAADLASRRAAGEWAGAAAPFRAGLDDGPQTPGPHSASADDAYQRYVDFLGAVYDSRAAW